MKKLDFIIIVFVGMLALLGMAISNMPSGEQGSKYAEIVVEGRVYKRVELKKDHSEKINVVTDHGYNTVYIHDGGAQVVDSDCADHVCVDTGFIDRRGQMIACLPHKMYVKIVGTSAKSSVDAVSQ